MRYYADGDDGEFVADRAAIAALFSLSERTVRRLLSPVGYDRDARGAALYRVDAETARRLLAVRARSRRT